MALQVLFLTPLRFNMLQLACTYDGIPGWAYNRMKREPKKAVDKLLAHGLVCWSSGFIVGTVEGQTIYDNELNKE